MDPSPHSNNRATQLTRGFAYMLRGFQLIRQPGIRRFVIVPLTINVVIFGSLIWALLHSITALFAWTSNAVDLGFLADLAFVQGLIWVIQFLLWAVVGVGVLLGTFYTFSLVANFLAAPFNSLLAEKVEKHLRGELNQSNESWMHAVNSIPHVMLSELFKLAYLMMWLIPLVSLWLITLFIPGLNILSTAAWLWFSVWLLSLEYVDYPAGNHGLNFPKVRKLMKQHRPSALGFGSAVTLMTSIPVLNMIAMPCAVAGATALWHEQLSEKAMLSSRA